MKTLAALAVTATTLSPTLALAGPDRPTGTIPVPIGSQVVDVWPYTTSDFEIPSDPVNLVFPGSDPREIRQAFLALDGNRTPSFPAQAPFNCTWTDAMGYEQAAWAETEGWVGRRDPARLRGAGRAPRQPLPLPRPPLPPGRGHVRERPLRVPDPRDGRARGPELGPRPRLRHPGRGPDRGPDGSPGGRADDPCRNLPGGETAGLRRAGGWRRHPDPRGRRALSDVGSRRRRRADPTNGAAAVLVGVDHRGARGIEDRGGDRRHVRHRDSSALLRHRSGRPRPACRARSTSPFAPRRRPRASSSASTPSEGTSPSRPWPRARAAASIPWASR